MAGQSDLALLHAVSQERDRAGLAVAVCPTELGLLCCSKADCCQGHCWYELAAVLPLEEELGSSGSLLLEDPFLSLQKRRASAWLGLVCCYLLAHAEADWY